MKECEALNSLEEILSLDVADNQFLWSPPHHTNATAAQSAFAATTAAAVTPNGNGFCDVSGSPDR